MMTPLRLSLAVSAVLFILCSRPSPSKCSALVQPQSGQTALDNSVQNKNRAETADNQSNAKADRLITANIWKAIIADHRSLTSIWWTKARITVPVAARRSM